MTFVQAWPFEFDAMGAVDDAVQDRIAEGGVADEIRRALPRAAHILLEDMLDATPRSGSTFRIADLPPGLTIVEVPQEEWTWPVVETLHNEIIGARERCVINGAHNVPDIFKNFARAWRA